jgi:hypothetical protein
MSFLPSLALFGFLPSFVCLLVRLFVCLFVFVFTFNGVSFRGLFSFPLDGFGGWICDQVQGIVKSPLSRSHVEEMAMLKDVTGYIMPGTLTLIMGK